MNLFKKHICNFNRLVYNIPRSNNTANVITRCQCGKIDHSRIHMESDAYKLLIKTLI